MRAAIAVVAAAFLVLTACDGSDGVPGPNSTVIGEEGDPTDVEIPGRTTPPPIFGENDAVLNVAIPEPATLDPMRINDPGAALVARQLYEGLTRWDPELEKVRPAAAESWASSSDGTLFEFKLRQGMTFHDGSPVTAEDFAFAFDRIAFKGNAAELAYTLRRVEGFDAVNGTGASTHLSGITTPNELTLRIQLSEPYQDFPSVLTHPGLVPVPKQAASNLDKFLTDPVGNGPFRMAQPWAPGNSVLLRAYEGFIETPELDGIRFLAYPDAAASWVDFVKGDIHVAEVPAGQTEDAAERFGDDNFKAFLKGEYIGLNLSTLRDEDLRKAISFGVDRQHIAQTVFKGRLEPARGIVPAGMAGFQENVCLDLCTYSASKARKFARKVPKKERVVTLTFTKGEPIDRLVKIVSRDLEAIGLEVKTTGLAFSPFLDRLRSGKHEAYRLGWIAEFPTPDAFLDPLFRSTSPDNHGAFSSGRIDALLSQAHRASSGGKRLSLYLEAEKQILRDYAIVPVGSFVSQWAVQPNVENIAFDVMGGFDAAEVDLADE